MKKHLMLYEMRTVSSDIIINLEENCIVARYKKDSTFIFSIPAVDFWNIAVTALENTDPQEDVFTGLARRRYEAMAVKYLSGIILNVLEEK